MLTTGLGKLGIDRLVSSLPGIIADEENQLTSLTRALIRDFQTELNELIEKIGRYDDRVQLIHDNYPVARQHTTIPGVGPLAATAMLATAELNLLPLLETPGNNCAVLLERGDGRHQRLFLWLSFLPSWGSPSLTGRDPNILKASLESLTDGKI